MQINIQDMLDNILYSEEKEKERQLQDVSKIQNSANNILNLNNNSGYSNSTYNPYSNGNASVQPMTISNPFKDLMKENTPGAITPDLIRNKAKEYLGILPNSISKTGNGLLDNSVLSNFDSSLDPSGLASLDIASELPKLSENQISTIISEYFSNSPVISASDAKGIYNAQNESGMSALAILGIGALESAYGTSNIAKNKNNLWGWNATNVNPSGNAKSFSPVAQGALEFAKAFMKTYYNGYGAKTIQSAGTGANPAGKGYAYLDNGAIEKAWSDKVSTIMGKFYNTAKAVAKDVKAKTTSTNALVDGLASAASALTNAANKKTSSTSTGSSIYANKVGQRIVETWNYPDTDGPRKQCVWYVRNRMKQKLGKDTGAIGDGNQMWYNAKPAAKVAAKTENLKPNMIVSYKQGTSSTGQTAGHVIFIEDVVGDTVYYTEGGVGYYDNKKDGVVKTATRKGILEGKNTSGGQMGSGVIGFIDLSKY